MPFPFSSTRRHLLGLLLGASACLASGAAPAQSTGYPTRPVRIIVPFTPGGTTDIFARLVGEKLSQSMGQQFVIENRGGAGGNIGTDAVAKAEPDGYTLVMGTVGTHAINPSLYAKMPYDALTDFAPVAYVAGVPNLMVVSPKKVKATTVQEFIAEAKADPPLRRAVQADDGHRDASRALSRQRARGERSDRRTGGCDVRQSPLLDRARARWKPTRSCCDLGETLPRHTRQANPRGSGPSRFRGVKLVRDVRPEGNAS
jgi:hypothetical protein